jgi:hypothetical protein
MNTFTFRETYITQPTRLYLSEDFINKFLGDAKNKSMSGIVKEIMQTGYPAPVRKRITDLTAIPGASNKSFLLYPEELFKGPVTSRMNAPPWMYMLWQNMKGKAAAIPQAAPTGADVVAATETQAQESVLGSIFDAYAEYVVPGFPSAVFDQLNSGYHCMGYVNNVTHTMSAQGSGNMSTNVNFTFLRTMNEFLGIMGDSSSFSTGVDCSPVEVIPQISETFQKLANAQKVYENLFYKGQKLTRPAVFDWRSMLY